MENIKQIPHMVQQVVKKRKKVCKQIWMFVSQKVNWLIHSGEQNEIQCRTHQHYQSGNEESNTIYNLNQRLEQQKQKLVKQVQKARGNADSPQQFFQLNKKFESYFIEFVKGLRLQPIIKDKKGKHYCFIGKTSVGKSSLYNALFDLHLEVGLGSCTKEVNQVMVLDNKTFWDAPGINDDFSMYTLDQLAFFNDLDQIYVLFDRDVDDVSLIIRILEALNKKVTFVRTKCDTISVNSKRTLQQELERDKKQILQIYPRCEKVIGVGREMYAQIKQIILSQK